MKKSTILKLKSQFFFFRAVIYFFFLLVPILIQKGLALSPAWQLFLMSLYLFFIIGQWFLLGKEIDHRFHIYFKVNSSVDRLLYRFLMGMIFFVIYFNLLALLPSKWTYNLYWVTWVLFGLFYSWPTRGKIIQESVTTNFAEMRYLDKFERIVLLLILGFFVITVPQLPRFMDSETIKLYLDPHEFSTPQFWNFLMVNYFPFRKYPDLFRMALTLHYYIIGLGGFLLFFYALLRYFFSRRLALLGVFAVISSWSLSKFLAGSTGSLFSSTFSLILVWSLLFIKHSGTYRTGLFAGALGLWAVTVNRHYFLMIPVILIMLYLFLLADRTAWYRRQVMKYSILGTSLALFWTIFNWGESEMYTHSLLAQFQIVMDLYSRKAFYSLSLLGFIILLLKQFKPDNLFSKLLVFSTSEIKISIPIVALCSFYALLFSAPIGDMLTYIWVIVLLSLIPLEMIFQHLIKSRSKRNLIFLIYILICIFDSHIEGRIKILARLLQ